jgi:capsular polysaccharide transport system permease protein
MTQAPAPPARIDAGGPIAVLPVAANPAAAAGRRRRLPWRLLSFVVVVTLPAIIAGAYYGIVAADQYVVELRFGLRTIEPMRSDPLSLVQSGMAASQAGFDSYALVQYLTSRAVIDDLAGTLDLTEMFSRPQADRLARLQSGATVEEMVVYWQGQVDAFFDPGNGTILVKARAFTAPDALALAQGIMAACERLVNGLSERARRDALRHSEEEVAKAQDHLKSTLARLREFRDARGVLDPKQAAASSAALAGRLRNEIEGAKAEYSALKNYMRPDAPSIKVLDARIQALEAERRAVEGELTTSEQPAATPLSGIMGPYEELEAERHFAENAYQRALEALDRARAAADRQQIYIAAFVPPSLPEEALYPRRLRAVGIVLLAAFALWAIGGLVMHSVRDHW